MDSSDMKISEIREWFSSNQRKEILSHITRLKQDPRAGVQQLLKQWESKEQLYRKKLEHWDMMTIEETGLKQQGIRYIVGIDEVGRGPLAGPVVAAAVILPEDFYLLGINDSKKLSASIREEYAIYIKEHSLAYSVSFVDSKEIDRINIYQATKKAMLEAIDQLPTKPEYALIDAMDLGLRIPSKSIIKGDAKSVSIAAASILAKVTRDEWMTQLSSLYPQYGFERNMGYGTKEHVEALHEFGMTPIHRRSFLNNQLNLSL